MLKAFGQVSGVPEGTATKGDAMNQPTHLLSPDPCEAALAELEGILLAGSYGEPR